MDLAPVIKALQATLVPQLRQQAEENLSQVLFLNFKSHISSFLHSPVKPPVLSHVLYKLFSMNNVIWVLDKLVKNFVLY
jgi:hypothetical protein